MNERPTKPVCYPSGLISVEEALAFILARARPVQDVESVPLEHTLGRVVALGQGSAIDVPRV